MRKIISFQIILLATACYSFAQNVGIGTSTPTEKLHVAGNIKVDTIKSIAIKLTANAGAGKVLTSDASGNATWQINNSTASGNVGFGAWGNGVINGNITEYNPIADPTGATNDNFGHKVSISDNFAIIGCPFDKVGINENQGSACIYRYNGSSWLFMQKLTDPLGGPHDNFGISVSISGNFAIVGAYAEGINNEGTASIYQYNGSGWFLMQKLNDTTGGVLENFGCSVAISGTYAIIGSQGDAIGANANQGSASIYRYNGSSWTLMQKINDATGAANDYFGHSVSISGNYAMAGSFGDDEGANSDKGSANIYSFNGSSWILMQKLTDASGSANDNFGYSVSISGNYAIVGASGDGSVSIPNQGSAIIYFYNGSTWLFMQKLINAGAAEDEHFGHAVSISGNYALVGSFSTNIAPLPDPGYAIIYVKLGGGWQRLQYVIDPAGNQYDQFGHSTAIDGTTQRFLIGAAGFANGLGKAVFGKIK